MKAATENLEKAAVEQQCRALRLPAVAEQCAPMAEVAIKQRQTYLSYLEALLAVELEERERNTIARRIKEAHLPRMKTLEEFDFTQAPLISATQIQELAQGGYKHIVAIEEKHGHAAIGIAAVGEPAAN